MTVIIKMPKLSPTMEKGILSKWIKKEGDQVNSGDVVAEVETDKAIMELEAADDGKIAKILIAEGSKDIEVGKPIAILAEDDEDPKNAIREFENSNDKAAQPKKTTEQNSDKIKNDQDEIINKTENKNLKSKRIFVSPLAKNLAKKNNISLAEITGSGPRGRIVKNDIEPFLGKTQDTTTCFSEEEITPMRQVIADRLTESKQNVPHFYLEIECNVSSLMNFRSEINNIGNETDKNYKISINDLIIKASALALIKHPEINSSWAGDKIVKYNKVDIAVAVAIKGGLMTPIVKEADKKSIVDISNEMKNLISAAKAQRLSQEQYQGGGFSISNLGMLNIKSFYPIINPPQSSIMGIGNIREVPFIEDNNLKVANIMSISLACDHRIIDGKKAAEFLNTFKMYLEKPLLLTNY